MDNLQTIKNKILANFYTWNNIPGNDKFSMLYKLYLDRAVQSILNLTNRTILIEPMQYIVLDMMNSFYNSEIARKSVGMSASMSTSENIKEIEEKDRRVVYGSSSDLSYNSIVSADIQEQLNLKMNEIIKFKLLYKVVPKNEKN